jgi:hypothetical protein
MFRQAGVAIWSLFDLNIVLFGAGHVDNLLRTPRLCLELGRLPLHTYQQIFNVRQSLGLIVRFQKRLLK